MNTNYEKRFLAERNNLGENIKAFNGGKAEIRNGLGEPLFTIHQEPELISNKVIIPGSVYTACQHFKIPMPAIRFPNYNTALGLENNESVTSVLNESVVLFAMGNDGALSESSQKLDVDYTKWIKPENLIPFKCQQLSNDLSPSERAKYFGRKVSSTDIKYYFKTFDSAPELVIQRVDGTPIDSNVYTSVSSTLAETFVKLRLKVTKSDFRDFFLNKDGNLNNAKVSSLSLLTAQKKTIGGYDYYLDIQPLTKLHFPTELLIDETKGLDIIYNIFY